MVKTQKYTYIPEEGIDTCKLSFDFEYMEEDGEIIIKHLIIDGEKGCIGHNKSMAILIRDKKISEIPIAELEEAGCRRAVSCNQILAKALQEIIEQKYKD